MDDVDFLLVNASQHRPRASWSQLEAIVGGDASTLSRRWSRLVDSGLVWSSCFAVSPGDPDRPDGRFDSAVHPLTGVLNRANLAVTFWLHSLRDLDAVETKIARAFPTARTEER